MSAGKTYSFGRFANLLCPPVIVFDSPGLRVSYRFVGTAPTNVYRTRVCAYTDIIRPGAKCLEKRGRSKNEHSEFRIRICPVVVIARARVCGFTLCFVRARRGRRLLRKCRATPVTVRRGRNDISDRVSVTTNIP